MCYDSCHHYFSWLRNFFSTVNFYTTHTKPDQCKISIAYKRHDDEDGTREQQQHVGNDDDGKIELAKLFLCFYLRVNFEEQAKHF